MGIAAQCLHGAGLCVIPKPANDHRPLALRHSSLAFVSALLIAAKVVALGVVALTPASADLSTITTARITELTNAERKKAGLQTLKVSSLLANAATQKGQHMLTEDYFAHISPSGVTPWFWMNKVGYTYQVAGENLAIDFLEAEDVVAAWLASPTHRDNMLHDGYTEMGVGVVTGEFQGGTSTVVVHMFGRPPGTAAPTTSVAPTPTPTPAVKADTTKQTTTPTPSPTPTPSTPVISPPPDTTPPRIPRIAVAPDTTIQDQLTLPLEGEPGSRVYVLINNAAVGSTTLNNQGQGELSVAVTQVPDGLLSVRAYATDATRNTSEHSPTITLTKDTQGPELTREGIAFVLSPVTDRVQSLITLDQASFTRLTIVQRETTTETTPAAAPLVAAATTPFTVTVFDSLGNPTELKDVSLAPRFSIDQNQTYVAAPTRFSQLTRRLTASIFGSILMLLIIAIIIRIRIQRPAMIAHASFVLLLAGLFFFL